MAKKIFITGGAGYVGSALVPRLLEEEYEVSVYDTYWYGDVFKDVISKKLYQIKGDIREREKLNKAAAGHDALIHLACVSNDPSYELNPSLGRAINYDAFFNVLEAAKQNGIQRFIYASSSSVYGVKAEKNVTEESLPEPLTDYSRYKLECEKALHTNSGDMEYVIVRPATVCGYASRLRLDLTVNILTIHALERGRIQIDGGKQLRPNINIEDMANVYSLLLSTKREKIQGQTFNAGYENHAVEDIAKMVRNVLEPWRGKIYLDYKEVKDNRSYHINSAKITRELGFVPQYTIEDAVASIAEAYKKGYIINGLENALYHNIKRMKEIY